MQYSDLHLDGFLAALLVPPESAIPLAIGFVLLAVSIFSLTCPPTDNYRWAWRILRLAIAPVAIYSFILHGYWPYETDGVRVDVGMAVVGLYGVMRVVETILVGLMDNEPPHWIVNGQKVPLPTTISGRLAYTIDLATSLRGNSWFLSTHWDWAPKALINSPACVMSRARFLSSSIISLIPQYFAMDVLDSINKSRTWDRSTPYPITSLPWHEQLIFSLSVCAQTLLSITIPYTIHALTFVLLGSHPESWPPMFNAPFFSSSLADFWTRRWHAIFRRVFGHFSTAILCIIPIPRSSPPSLAERTIRSVVIFGLSATLHILLMYRIDMVETGHPQTFLDPSILKFFLSMPLGLTLEALVVLPMSKAFVPAGWRITVSRVWAWAFLLWAGRFWSDVWVHRGFWDEKERVVGWSVVRGVLYGEWAT